MTDAKHLKEPDPEISTKQTPSETGASGQSVDNKDIHPIDRGFAKTKSAWRIIGASVTGTSHHTSQQPCQDAFQCQLLPDGGVLIVVADGAGSADKAEEGSAMVVKKACAFMHAKLTANFPQSESGWRELVQAAIEDTRTALSEHAANAKKDLRSYAATFMLAAVTRDCIVGALIGDCGTVAMKESGQLFSLCAPQKGEYANVTHFITQDNALDSLDIQIYSEPIKGVAVFSDGLLEMALNISDNQPFAPFFKPLFSFAAAAENDQEAEKQLAAFLNSARVNARTNDDKTLVLAQRTAIHS